MTDSDHKINDCRSAVRHLRENGEAGSKSYDYPIGRPVLPKNIAPADVEIPVLATDSAAYPDYCAALYGQNAIAGGFPGFAYLSQLATRAEYRAMVSAMASELVRKWIEFVSTESDNEGQTAERIKLITAEFEKLGVKKLIETCAQHDGYFGRAQIYIDLGASDDSLPLVLSDKTIGRGALKRLVAVEPIWTTPVEYNALNPAAPDFYRPSKWWMLGKPVHSTRLLTIITRPLPDILKPSFNFAGMSLSQLAEPYVDNWLRTRQSVSDLINNFSTSVLKTAMGQVLQGNDMGASLLHRADLFTLHRSNKGVMLLDKDTEDFVQQNVPLGGLHELQAQAQEHMCSVSRIPAMILTGISPSGLNASSEGEIRVFYDWIMGQLESFWREPLEIIMKVVQLSLFGEIDRDIKLQFVPLMQMTDKELAEIRNTNAQADAVYIDRGIVDTEEVRTKLANDPESGFYGLDLGKQIEPAETDDVPPMLPGDPTEPNGMAGDKGEWREQDHPRAKNGQFGSGGGGQQASGEKPKDKKDAHSAVGYTDSRGNARSPNLSKSERAIESRFYNAIDSKGPALMAAYHAKFGNKIDPDLVKSMSPAFAKNPDLAAAVHEPSSKLAKMIYKDALERKAAAGDKSPTVFTAGGSGSGKSTTMPGALEALGAKADGLIYDSVLSSPGSAKTRIDQALSTTEGPVGIAYTNADIRQALIQNAKRGRSVSIDTLLHAHVGASNTIRELAEHYKDNPRVKIQVMNNLGAPEDVAPGKLSDVPKYEPRELRRQLVDVAKKLRDTGVIDQKKFELLTK